jgi:hypothetical protein
VHALTREVDAADSPLRYAAERLADAGVLTRTSGSRANSRAYRLSEAGALLISEIERTAAPGQLDASMRAILIPAQDLLRIARCVSAHKVAQKIGWAIRFRDSTAGLLVVPAQGCSDRDVDELSAAFAGAGCSPTTVTVGEVLRHAEFMDYCRVLAAAANPSLPEPGA